MPADCSVSFVVTSRNDDHGGDMLHRFEMFADALLEQANRHSLSGELIVVEWNPPSGPRLHEALKLRVKSDCFAIRFIEVPLEAHGRIRNADVIPLFQMIAKNVGIHRAKGEFILATNPDLLFSDALIAFLASGKLLRDVMYRIDRHDVPAEVPDNTSIDKQLAWCAANVLRVHRRRGSFRARRQLLSTFWALDWRKVRQLNPVGVAVRCGNLLWRELTHLSTKQIEYLLDRLAGTLYGPRLLLRRVLWGILQLTDPLPKVHTNACGDFTLMSKARWFELGGYPELPLWSMHVDSLLCYMAVASGLREHVLRPPAKIFHMEHHNSWVVMTPDQRLKTFTVKPWIDIGLLSELWRNMYSSSRPIQFNPENWGLADWPLKEVTIQSGEKHCFTSTPLLRPKGEHPWDLTDHRPSRPSLSSV
jgi:hypothetical protein